MYPKEPPMTDAQRIRYLTILADSHEKSAARMYGYWQQAEAKIKKLEASRND